jgi:serine/threonine protein phosphatase PrpC
MPSIKKRVTGFMRERTFIRHFSAPSQSEHNGKGEKSSPRSPVPAPALEKCFIQRYLGGEERPTAPEILHGKTGYQLPFFSLGTLEPEVFAASTGPGGGLTAIKRKEADPQSPKNSEDLDYIDLDGTRGASRRSSIADVIGTFESITQPLKINGHQPPSPEPEAEVVPKVPKSPVNCIDNTVMNIRVGDRVYKVDDRNKLKLIEDSPVHEFDSEFTTRRDSVSPKPDAVSPDYKTSEIIDVDTQLDLVETEDGYMPANCLSPKEEQESMSMVRKRVTIKSPQRRNARPSSLNIGSRNSFNSHSSKGSNESASNYESPKSVHSVHSSDGNLAPPRASLHIPSKTIEHSLKKQTGQSKSTANIQSDYPELQSLPKALASPSTSQLNDTSEIIKKLQLNLKDDISTSIAGIRYWNRPNNALYGLSDTLYERHPLTGEAAGSPIADTFAVVARKNSAILVLGDGVNWGARAALASRAAVHGAMEYLNSALFGVSRNRSLTTQDVFQILLRSFHAAHCLILEEEAMLTTLTAAVVLPTIEDGGLTKFHACVCNVGDSLAYVYSSGQVREITQGSHDITANRDMRDALGALGPVDGLNPELSNLTCSITEVLPGDIVFLTSDGISDNFDPVVGKFCVPKKPERNNSQKPVTTKTGQTPTRTNRSHSDFDFLPTVEAFQRHELTLARIEDILNHGSGSVPSGMDNAGLQSNNGRVSNSAELCHRMLDFCQRLTTAKRKILEDPDLYPKPEEGPDKVDQKVRRRRVCEKLALVPGKLDHATIAAYQVADRTVELADYLGDKTDIVGSITPGLASGLSITAPHASCEDLTMRESPVSSEDLTPTASVSLNSTPFGSGCNSLAATPTRGPQSQLYGMNGQGS